MRSSSLVIALFLLAAVSGFQAQAEPVPEIPFSLVDGFILIKAQVAGKAEPVTMLLDSGAGASVLSLGAARRLGVKLGNPQSVRGVDADAVAYRIEPLKAAAGDIPLAEIPLAVDLHNAGAICSRPIDGLIGVDFFRGRIVQIDYASERIRFLQHAEPGATASVLPIQVTNGVLCVPVSVNESTVRWTRLDTGCNDDLHWVIPRPTASRRPRGVSIGFLSATDETALTTVRLGNESLRDVETCLHGRPLFPGESGLLGSGILAQFKVTVDAPGGRVILEPPGR